jgi:hypothetical protein
MFIPSFLWLLRYAGNLRMGNLEVPVSFLLRVFLQAFSLLQQVRQRLIPELPPVDIRAIFVSLPQLSQNPL